MNWHELLAAGTPARLLSDDVQHLIFPGTSPGTYVVRFPYSVDGDLQWTEDLTQEQVNVALAADDIYTDPSPFPTRQEWEPLSLVDFLAVCTPEGKEALCLHYSEVRAIRRLNIVRGLGIDAGYQLLPNGFTPYRAVIYVAAGQDTSAIRAAYRIREQRSTHEPEPIL